MIKVMRAKFHCLRVTAGDLNYHGSITLDPQYCHMVGILPLEFVEIWNKNSGARISTYVLYGTPGSKCCILNGAAARTCQIGDEVIICAYEYISSPVELLHRQAKVLCFDAANEITEALQYDVTAGECGEFQFAVKKSQ